MRKRRRRRRETKVRRGSSLHKSGMKSPKLDSFSNGGLNFLAANVGGVVKHFSGTGGSHEKQSLA